MMAKNEKRRKEKKKQRPKKSPEKNIYIYIYICLIEKNKIDLILTPVSHLFYRRIYLGGDWICVCIRLFLPSCCAISLLFRPAPEKAATLGVAHDLHVRWRDGRVVVRYRFVFM